MIVQKKREWIGLVIGIFFTVLIAWYTYFFQRCASYVLYPFLAAHHAIIEPFSRSWLSDEKATISKRYRILQKKYHTLQARIIELEGTQAYLEKTQELREFAQRYNQPYRVCKVLARVFSDHEQSFFIEGGELQGFQKDMAVLYCNSVVGKICEVYPWYCKVCAITDKRCKVGAYSAQTHSKGIHEGTNSMVQTELNYVDHLATIKQGELILTDGQGLVFPEGFALGTVISIAPDGLYQHVLVKPLYPLQLIEHCVVFTRK